LVTRAPQFTAVIFELMKILEKLRREGEILIEPAKIEIEM